MCRFLLAKSNLPLNSSELLVQFSNMAEQSRAPDGDRQADGWGIMWMENHKWQEYKSLKPVWESTAIFAKIPKSNLLAIHVRSASFPDQKGIIEYNQPYIHDDLCFVFNGVITGVKIDRPLKGSIGAQKIFSLIEEELQEKSPVKALHYLDQFLLHHAKLVNGLNVGLVNDNSLYALCEYEDNSDYFGLKYYTDDSVSLICSEKIGPYAWKTMKKREVIRL